MKRIIAFILACMFLLTACGAPVETTTQAETEPTEETEQVTSENTEAVVAIDSTHGAEQESEETGDKLGETTSVPDITIKGLDDEALLEYVEDNVYSTLVSQLDSDDYFVEYVDAVYYPKEYIEALASNTQPNVYFGYTAAELNEQFQGTKYVFTLGENGQTVVVPMETVSDEVYVKAMEDVIIGSGVILVCVTVSIVASPAAPAVSMIFAASATTGTTFALESGTISFFAAAIAKGYETESLEQAFKAGVEAGGEGFKWGAIIGSAVGGGKEAIALKGATVNGLTMNEVARIQQESGYPLSIIKQFHTVEEYTVFKNAGLQAEMIGGKLTLVRPDIDLYNVLDEYGQNNYARLTQGLNPIDATGKPFEWHHIGQNNNATLALLTSTEHDAGALHGFKVVSEIDRKAFNTYKKEVLNKALLRWLLASA